MISHCMSIFVFVFVHNINIIIIIIKLNPNNLVYVLKKVKTTIFFTSSYYNFVSNN